jgi:hypothetical protein
VIELFPPAKVNLALRVTGERPDGYHDLWSVVQKVDLCDRLALADRPDGEVSFTCDRPELAGPDNLAWRAARLLRERLDLRRGADIRLEKRIPAGAGLGGGELGRRRRPDRPRPPLEPRSFARGAVCAGRRAGFGRPGVPPPLPRHHVGPR